MDATTKSLLFVLGIDVCVLAFSFCIFLCVRWYRRDRNRVCEFKYSSEPLLAPAPPGVGAVEDYYGLHRQETSEQQRRSSVESTEAQPALYRTYTLETDADESAFAFFRYLWSVNVDKFFSADVRFYLKFTKTAAIATSCLSVFAIVIMLPIHVSASTGTQRTWLERCSIGSIPRSGWRVWALYVATWLYSLTIFAFASLASLKMRKFRTNPAAHFLPEKYAVMVRGMDKKCADSSVLRQQFEKLQPGKVVDALVVPDYSLLLEVKKVEQLLTPEQSSQQTLRQRAAMLEGSRAEGAVTIIPAEEDDNSPESPYSSQEIRPSHSTGQGFVTFMTSTAAAESVSDPRAVGNHHNWEIDIAPSPGDIIWANMHFSPSRCIARSIGLNILLFMFSIFLTSSALLSDWLLPLMEDFEKAVHRSDFLRMSLSGYMAPLVLFVINSLILPTCVWSCAIATRYSRYSAQAAAILNGNAVFLVLNSLIFPILGTGSVWALINWAYHTEILRWNIQLSDLIVTQSGAFAIKYLLNACLLSTSSELLRMPQIVYKKGCQIMKRTPRPWFFDFGYHHAFCTSIFTMALVLSVILPLVLPLAALFFTLKFWVDKYNFLFAVWEVEIDSAGAVTKSALSFVVFAATFMQFIMSGYFLGAGLGSDRALTLAGTLLFLSSFIVFFTQFGQLLNIGSFSKNWKPSSEDGGQQPDGHVKPEELMVLKLAYVHPFEKRARRFVASRQLQDSSIGNAPYATAQADRRRSGGGLSENSVEVLEDSARGLRREQERRRESGISFQQRDNNTPPDAVATSNDVVFTADLEER